ncbi:hypothetical protein BH10CYA1_BH10CYA1_03380 [soil metagenome]
MSRCRSRLKTGRSSNKKEKTSSLATEKNGAKTKRQDDVNFPGILAIANPIMLW